MKTCLKRVPNIFRCAGTRRVIRRWRRFSQIARKAFPAEPLGEQKRFSAETPKRGGKQMLPKGNGKGTSRRCGRQMARISADSLKGFSRKPQGRRSNQEGEKGRDGQTAAKRLKFSGREVPFFNFHEVSLEAGVRHRMSDPSRKFGKVSGWPENRKSKGIVPRSSRELMWKGVSGPSLVQHG